MYRPGKLKTLEDTWCQRILGNVRRVGRYVRILRLDKHRRVRVIMYVRSIGDDGGDKCLILDCNWRIIGDSTHLVYKRYYQYFFVDNEYI